MYISVQSGTNAGWRKLYAAVKKDWKCPGCASFNRYYWVKCPACSHPRD